MRILGCWSSESQLTVNPQDTVVVRGSATTGYLAGESSQDLAETDWMSQTDRDLRKGSRADSAFPTKPRPAPDSSYAQSGQFHQEPSTLAAAHEDIGEATMHMGNQATPY